MNNDTNPTIVPLAERYSLRRGFSRFAWLAAAIMIVIALVYLLAVVDWTTGGSARHPTDVGGELELWTVCPSAADNPERAVGAALLVASHALPTLIRVGPCDGPPAELEAQIRSYTDQVDPFRYELPEGYAAHTVTEGRPVRRAVIYVDRWAATPCTYAHELLHTHGLGLEVDGRDGHASSGVLAAECGLSWELVDQVIAARGAR